MPAKNIECQLAQGQIGRYLAGVDMSAEAVSQLELHIAECEDCTTFVDAKRKSLQELSQTRRAAISIPEPELETTPAPTTPTNPARISVGQALVEAIRQKADPVARETVLETVREPAAPRRKYWKALGYSLALGAVLLAMSHIAANPTALFGERVGPGASSSDSETTPKKALAPNPPSDGDPFTAEPPIAKPTTPGATDTAAANGATAEPKPASTKPPVPTAAPSPNSEPPNQPITSTPAGPRTAVRSQRPRRATRTVRPASRRTQGPARAGNSIRVYGPDGKPIN